MGYELKGQSNMVNETPDKRRFSRRNFLGIAWAGSLVALFGQAGVALLQYLQPRTNSGGFGGKVTAGQPKEFKNNTVSLVQKGRFYVSRLDDGTVLAISWHCTHLGCTVPWNKTEKQFHCPCHSSLYNAKGEVIGGPAPRPLDLYPIEVVDGKIVVDTSSAISRDKFDPSQATKV